MNLIVTLKLLKFRVINKFGKSYRDRVFTHGTLTLFYVLQMM